VATLTLRLDNGQFADIELTRSQLEELGLSAGDEVALRNPLLAAGAMSR
jgi:hypothetical protein